VQAIGSKSGVCNCQNLFHEGYDTENPSLLSYVRFVKDESMITELLLAALIQVESSGNNLAVGDNGKAIGCLQIHAGVVQDYNRWNGTHLTHSSMTNRALSIAVCRAYIAHYGASKSIEAQARIWNGGPKGDTKTATIGYWNKVKNNLPLPDRN
jgi:hypothetical protein